MARDPYPQGVIWDENLSFLFFFFFFWYSLSNLTEKFIRASPNIFSASSPQSRYSDAGPALPITIILILLEDSRVDGAYTTEIVNSEFRSLLRNPTDYNNWCYSVSSYTD